MQLHFPSLVVGVAAAAVLLVSMSQTTPSSGPPRIEYGPNPRDMVQIKEGTPYTVPVGKLFVLTGLGATGINGFQCSLVVNGQIDLSINAAAFDAGSVSTVAPVPTGYALPAGTLIGLSGPGSGRAWGYLADR